MIPEYDCYRCGNDDLYDQLYADASRFAIFRAMATEPDDAKRERMHDAFEAWEPPFIDGVPTVEQFNDAFDEVLANVVAARDELPVESKPL